MIVDFSKNNGLIDFTKLPSDIEMVILRATMGTGTTDKMFVTNVKNALAAGKKVADYHFSYPDKKQGGTVVLDATSEANYFCDVILAVHTPEEVVIDCEPKDAAGNDTNLTPTEYALWLQTWLDIVESRTGKQSIIYTYADYLSRHLPQGHTFGKYRLWIASYSHVVTPILPHGWTTCYMWQYSASGTISGVNGKVDISKFNS